MADVEKTPVSMKAEKKKKKSATNGAVPVPPPQEARQPGQITIDELNQIIQKQTAEFNQLINNIASARTKLTGQQSRSLSKSLRLNKAISTEDKENIEKALQADLLEVSETRDMLADQQGQAIEVSIQLFRNKELFYQTAMRIQRDELLKQATPASAKPPTPPPKLTVVEEVVNEESDEDEPTEAVTMSVPAGLAAQVKELLAKNTVA